MSLSDFRAALLNPDLPAPPGLTDPEGRPAGRRFSVYRNNVTVGLTEALRQSFPVIRKLVGEDFFTAMAQEHLRAHPPVSPLMMFYGAEMPAFLESFPPVSHLPYLADVARLELALRHAYHAADIEALPPEKLQSLDSSRLIAACVTFAPAIRLLRSRWPIHAIWSANMRGTAPPTQAEAQDLLITRPEFDPEPHLLPPGAGAFVESLIAGQTFGAALDATDPFDLTATLGILLQGRAITALNEDATP